MGRRVPVVRYDALQPPLWTQSTTPTMVIDFAQGCHRIGITLAALLCLSCTSTPRLGDRPDPAALHTFLERRAVCDHLRGEMPDPDDPASMEAAISAINPSCTGTDAELLRLKRLHAGDAAVMKQLNALEPCIESSSRCGVRTPAR